MAFLWEMNDCNHAMHVAILHCMIAIISCMVQDSEKSAVLGKRKY
jgi:hypothetical protein